MVYQPMLELLAYLRANGFQDVHRFRRRRRVHARLRGQSLWHPPEQVVGSTGKLRFELGDGHPVLVKLPEVQFIDDKEGKPVGIR